MSEPEPSVPEPRRLEDGEIVAPAALVVPAVAEPPLEERRPWLEDHDIVDAITVPGCYTPLYLTDEGVAITTTGIGKSDAATTVTALLATPSIDLSSAYVLSTGIAGAPPDQAALGSVVVADAVVDWDRKHRWGRSDSSGDSAIDLLSYRPREYAHRLEADLVESALDAAQAVSLLENDDARAYQDRYPDAVDAETTVRTGTTVCGDEFWHGSRHAREVEWLCEQYGVAPYVTTQMEDAATATALARFGVLERYLSVRAVANYDRPAPGESVEESFDGTGESLELAIENAAIVGSAVVSVLLETDPLGVRA
ncbi:phosphorylase family protein [Natronobacterium gregoryi]|uniref:Phosphorylase n=2 Tax=Natronobacterium gregoryi TaxID=44930 RepID=L0AG76_NATGS|nr:phosphorylase [Natronobacterium gregoryi]AFZ72142.1 purine nucleoside permease [Natronobacterium gregoryi SP2]ELY62828.1 purine nucleoside permease [Natronobacterium gregoryi SP2]PLK19284.1 phosphorylase [Natronobacterium gregoryi SP2]SFJ54465.1 Purine nucleoside permease [Natronobacterium gregoryi]